MVNKSKEQKMPPVFLVNTATRIVRFLQKIQTRLMTPQSVLLNYIIGNVVVYRSVYVAAELGIADLLKEGPKNIEELAGATHTDPESLLRIMRSLTSASIFRARKDGYFETNRLGRQLQSDLEDSLYSFVKVTGSEWVTEIWSDLLQSARTGKDHYEIRYGMSFFDWLRTNKDAQKVFNEGAGNISTLSDKPVAAAYDFSAFSSMIDLGGGKGSQIIAILERHPETACTLFDLPLTIETVKNNGLFEKAGLGGKVELIPGDFLESVPTGFDCYYMKSILHDLDEEDCLLLLANCRQAMGKDAVLLVVDNVVNEDYNVPDFSKMLDVNLLALMGGKVRTKSEYVELIERSGFKFKREIFTASPFNILEAVPA